MLNELLIKRRSIKSFSSLEVEDSKIELLFQAASIAPSSYNEQPWRFIYAKKENQAEFERLLNLMSDKNKLWAESAGLLVLAVSKKNISVNGRFNKYHFYDVSSAVANLTFQALSMNLFVHQIGGFDSEKSREQFQIPEEFEPVVMLAVGYSEESEILSKPRRTLSEIVFEGRFGNPAKIQKEILID